MIDPAGMYDPLPHDERNGKAGSASTGTKLQWRPITPVPDDVLPNVPRHRAGTPSAIWDYCDAAGRLLGRVCRFDTPEGKLILPLTYCESGRGTLSWRWQAPLVPRPLYALNRLTQHPDAAVLVVEGEKSADAAAKLFPDHVVVTSSGGAKAAGKADWSPLAGRDVVIWPDNDVPGSGYAAEVGRLVNAAGARLVRIVAVPNDWRDGWDLADELSAGVTAEMLSKMIEGALALPELGPGERGKDEGGAAAPNEVDLATEVKALAALSPLEYDQARETAAKRFNVRLSTLDAEVLAARGPVTGGSRNQPGDDFLAPVEPWTQPVDGAVLLAAIVTALKRFAVLPKWSAEAISLWIVFAHAHDAADHSPILNVTSPEKRCGKTLVLAIIGELVPKFLPAANISSAALFRTVEKYRPTLGIDEADTFLRAENQEMRGIVNSGFTRASACVIRCDGEDLDPRPFSTWCAKLIAGIGELPGTIRDRSIIIALRRKLAGETVERLQRWHHAELHELRAKAARWAADHMTRLTGADPEMPTGLDDRAEDAWRQLFAIADAAGGDWPTLARKAAVVLSGAREDDTAASAGVLLLSHIRTVFADERTESVRSQVLCDALIKNESWPWGEWRQGKPISARGVARLLAKFDIQPKRDQGASQYHKVQFRDAFARYLSTSSDSTRGASATSAMKSENTGISEDFAKCEAAHSSRLQECVETPAFTGSIAHIADREGEPANGHTLSDEELHFASELF